MGDIEKALILPEIFHFRLRCSWTAIAVLVLLGGSIGSVASAQASCPAGALATSKRQTLYLYFPTSSDSSFPDYSQVGASTSPLNPFNVADLDAGIGTTAQLRQRIFELVTDDYCEFDVKVVSTTTAPSPSESRWQIAGVGTDSATYLGNALFGEAQAVDTNDVDPQDYARIWAKSFKDAFGGTGGALAGTNSTLQRWATAIGETTAHEAGHNFGLGHGHSAPRAGSAEDEQNNHIMATGSTGLTGEMRASRDRHFSDTEYEILGHNLGLTFETLHNWDFANPNDTNANKMQIKILSTAGSLTIGWFWTGTSSPWTNPTITNTGTTQTFQGTTYNVFILEFSAPKAWSGGTNGVVPPGIRFHTGASFTGGGPVVVYETKLFNGSTALPLSPRLFGYDAGTADLASGDFALGMFNTDPSAGDLIIRNLQVVRLPRMLAIDAMVRDARPVDVRGRPVESISSTQVKELRIGRERVALPIGKLTDKRHVDIIYGPEDCPDGSIGSGIRGKAVRGPGEPTGPGDVAVGELKYCHKGNALSLFPSTYTYILATVVAPNAKHWDPAQSKFVTGPLESRLFYQFGGIVPDFNNNGVDDLIDIRQGTSVDKNQNGVPDEAEPVGARCCDLSRTNIILIVIVVLLVVIIVLVLLLGRQKR